MVDHEEDINKIAETAQNNAKKIKNESEINEVDVEYSNVQWKYMKKSLTNSEILAQAILFIFAGIWCEKKYTYNICIYLKKNYFRIN